MTDFPITQGDWTFLGPRTLVHTNGSVVVHNGRRYYRLEMDAIDDGAQAELNRKLLAKFESSTVTPTTEATA